MAALTFKLVAYLVSPMTWISFVFGALIGSFLNVCIFRIPEGNFLANKRSVCRGCGKQIPGWWNIPIVSWLLLRGKAKCCGVKLSLQYPLVELLTALTFVVVYWKFPFIAYSGGILQWDYGNVIRAFHAATFCCILLVCSGIDWRHMIIPDVISLPMIALTPLVVMIHPDLDWTSGLVGVLAGGLSLYAIAWLYWLVRKEVGMGMGDVKLLAGIGGWLGYQSIIPTIFYGSIMGAAGGLLVMVFTKRLNFKSAVPFGPFLAAGAIIHLLVGPYLQELLVVSGLPPG